MAMPLSPRRALMSVAPPMILNDLPPKSAASSPIVAAMRDSVDVHAPSPSFPCDKQWRRARPAEPPLALRHRRHPVARKARSVWKGHSASLCADPSP
eukprot:2434345-Pleurochrysis_carterae.AAC.2